MDEQTYGHSEYCARLELHSKNWCVSNVINWVFKDKLATVNFPTFTMADPCYGRMIWKCTNLQLIFKFVDAVSGTVQCFQLSLTQQHTHTHTHTHTRLTALFPGLPRWAGTRKAKPICILLKQETVSGSGISWNICKSAPRSRLITTPTTHHSVFYRPDALPTTQPTASKHWRQS